VSPEWRPGGSSPLVGGFALFVFVELACELVGAEAQLGADALHEEEPWCGVASLEQRAQGAVGHIGSGRELDDGDAPAPALLVEDPPESLAALAIVGRELAARHRRKG
jgi:hypothetical protein